MFFLSLFSENYMLCFICEFSPWPTIDEFDVLQHAFSCLLSMLLLLLRLQMYVRHLTKDPSLTLQWPIPHDPMDLSPEPRALSSSSVCLLQGVLNIQNHYSATMHYSTPKTPDKGPIHKTDWTCSKVMMNAGGVARHLAGVSVLGRG